MTAWTELPAGHDILLKPGFLFAFLARVKNNHPKSDISALAKGRGFRVDDYQDRGSAGGNYRNVAIMGLQFADGGTLPWSSPAPILDETSLVKAWAALATGSAPHPPGPLTQTSANTGIIVASLAAASAAAYLLWRRFKRG